jgi:ribosomal protein S24E
MKVELEAAEDNNLMDRVEAKFSVLHQGKETPSEEDVVSRVAAEISVSEDNIDVGSIETQYGTNLSLVDVEINEDIELTEETTEETDYQEIVSGTISEAKEKASETDSIDYDQMLEAEKNNKNRKTLKQWIEGKTEE